MLRLIAFALLAVLLNACGTDKYFKNRLLYTADCKEMRVCSDYGPLCIGAKIAEEDAAAVLPGKCAANTESKGK